MYSLEFLQTLGVAPSQQALNASQLAGMGLWLASAIAKVAIGIGAIFIWRLAAKRVLYTILPPLFKLFQPIISLPRKGYETARWGKPKRALDRRLTVIGQRISADRRYQAYAAYTFPARSHCLGSRIAAKEHLGCSAVA